VASLASSAPAASQERRRPGISERSWYPYLLWLPTILVLILMVVYPTIYLVKNSLYRSNPMALGLTQFVGLGNFRDALTRPEFWGAVRRTAVFVTASLAAELVIGTLLALLVATYIGRFQGLYKVLLIAPMMMTPVAVGLVWRWMFDASMGVINYLLGLVGIQGPIWLGGEATAMAAVTVVEIWQWTPFVFLAVLAGMSALPSEPLEAARVDGANGWQIFSQITMPLLMPVFAVVIVFRFIDIFKAFDIIYVLTEGGPGEATTTLPYYIYQQAFRYFNTGYAAAVAWLLLVLIVAIYSWMLRRLLGEQLKGGAPA